jgi:DNA mismatch repair protein MutL
MIENSIDAGAKHITVEIQNGGITFMRISDDGCGMDADDLPLAIKRHATSKIRNAEDLDGICTLGFRGEALAAIAAVSNLRIISKPRSAEMGAELTVSCGEIVDLCERGCSDGTTIIAEDLFENVPARRKFLKRDVTETTAVCANVEKIALSHPEIAFRLITDGQIKLETSGDGKLINTIYSVFGRDFASKLIEVNGELDGISVSGYIGRSDNVKGNRNYENFYINKRFIKSRTASAAIEQAFVSYMPSEKFPVCVLFISLNPSRVDVNVHPAKLEVKFSNEKPVFEAIYYAVRQALESNTARPQMSAQTPRTAPRVSDSFVAVERGESVQKRQLSMDIPHTRNAGGDGQIRMFAEQYRNMTGGAENNSPAATVQQASKTPPKEKRITAEEYVREYILQTDADRREFDEKIKNNPGVDERVQRNIENAVAAIFGKKVEKSANDNKQNKANEVNSAPFVAEPPEEKAVGEEISVRHYRIVGETFNSYIVVEMDDKMLIIDKHAAHERIIFEQLKKNMYASKVASQLLMLPIEIMLMSDEVDVIEEYRSEIEAVGFDFTCSRNTVLVNALPSGIEQDAVADMFAVMADRIKNGTGNVDITRNIVFEKALYQASCKAAIKAGREYPEGHQKWVVDQLMKLPDITFCPHGRPVAMEMSKKNIDRQFERT